MDDIDREGERRDLRPEEIEARSSATKRIWDLNRWEEISWRQKSRVTWLKEGDKNTSFIHRLASLSRVNFLGQIRQGGRVLESPSEVKEVVARFFEDIYSGENVVRPKLDSLNSSRCSKMVGKRV